MVDILIHTDAHLHKDCDGEIVWITIGKFKKSICVKCGKVTSNKEIEYHLTI